MKNFNEVYKEICEQCTKPMEEMRKDVKNRTLKVLMIAIIVGGIAIFLLYNIVSFIWKLICFIIVVILIMSIYTITSKKNKNYNKFFKDNVINMLIKECCKNLEYIPTGELSQYIYIDGEFEKYNRYYSEDLIQGTIDNKYNVTMAEVRTEVEEIDSDGNSSTRTVFHGLVARVDLERLINANIKIRRNTMRLFQDDTKIEMDSGEFEKEYDVYATDRMIAMQILTADVMQMILDFKEKNGIRPELTLKGNTLYIRFSTGKLFEAKVFTNSLDYKTLEKYYYTINFTLDIAKQLL